MKKHIDLSLGFSFDRLMELGGDEEQAAVNKRISSAALHNSLVRASASICEGTVLVAFASVWCPDCVVAVSILETICAASSGKIKTVYLERDDEGIKEKAREIAGSSSIPLIFATDRNGNIKSEFFIERPKRFVKLTKETNESERAALIDRYRAGEFDDMIQDELEEILTSTR